MATHMKQTLYEKCNLIYPASVLVFSWTLRWLHERGTVWKVQVYYSSSISTRLALTEDMNWMCFLFRYIVCWPLCSNGFNPIRTDLQKQAWPFRQCSNLGPWPKYVTTFCINWSWLGLKAFIKPKKKWQYEMEMWERNWWEEKYGQMESLMTPVVV